MKSGVAAATALLAAAGSASAQKKDCVTLVTGDKLEAAIATEAVLAHAQKLQDIAYSTPGRNRQWTQPGFEMTLDYIRDTLEAKAPGYYDVEFAPTEYRLARDPTPFVVNGVEYATAAMTDNDRVLFEGVFTGRPVVEVANLGCNPSDYPDATGAITLILRGNCTFELKSQLSKAAGAVAAAVYNAPNSATFGNGVIGVGFEGKVPTTMVRSADGIAIRDLIRSGAAVTADLTIEYVTLASHNLIATTKWGNQSNVLMVGAHADSVSEGPGINDDGSGTVGILEAAVQLAKFGVRNAVRFAWWSAEEDGLLGSSYYTDHLPAAELAKIRAYLNFDMIGSNNFIYGIYDGDGDAYGLAGPPGSAEIEELYETYLASRGLPSDPSEFSGRSDYAGFIDKGIPSGGLFTGADEVKTPEQVAKYGGVAGAIMDPNYHTANDTLEHMNVTALGVMSKALAYSIGTYARSFEGFPERSAPAAPVARRRNAALRDTSAEFVRVGPLKLWRL